MPKGPERKDPERSRRARNVYHMLEAQDPRTRALSELRARFTYIHEENNRAIEAGQFAALQDYPLDEFPVTIKPYPIRLSRRGSLYTNDLTQHYYLPHRREVPNALIFTVGDLHAAAQWHLIPHLENAAEHRNEEYIRNALRAVNDVQYHTFLRMCYTYKHRYDQQLLDVIGTTQEEEEKWANLMQDAQAGKVLTRDVTPREIEEYLTRPSILAERFVFTLLARLEDRAQPPFTVFQPRAGVERFKKVDLLVRMEPEGEHPWLIGLDVTTTQSAEVIWGKHIRAGALTRQPTTKDPLTGETLYLYTRLALWPTPMAQPTECYRQWQQQRGDTAVTPEYFIDPAARRRIAEHLLYNLRRPNDEPLYSDETAAALHTTVYGQFDERRQK